MTEIEEKTAEAFDKANAKREAEAPTPYRTILVAACVGVLIGLLVRR